MHEGLSSVLELEIPWLLVLCCLPLLSYIYSVVSLRLLGPKAPLFGPQSFFEPRAIVNYRFFKNAKSIVNGGYAKVKILNRRNLYLRVRSKLTRISPKMLHSGLLVTTLILSSCLLNT